jgi:2,4-dienoyl-CoA reductase-like NADH-dependent reductase (Old Yellow Enzyme family)
MRFLLEIVRAVRRAVGAAYPISVKLNSADFQRGGFSEEESMDVAAALERERIDLLEISGGNYENPAMMGMRQSTREREAYFLDYARAVRQRVATPLMLTGGFRSGAAMRAAVEEGAVDVVGLARPLAAEPDFPARILERRAERAAAVRTRVGIRLVDDMMQSFWFNQQMHRMARGLEPDLNRSRLLTLMVGVKTNLIWNPFRRGA